MSGLEVIFVVIFPVLLLAALFVIYFLVRSKRDLENTLNMQNKTLAHDQSYIQTLKEKIIEAEKKSKMSDDVLEILNDLKKGGALLEVTRVDRNDIFFHNGGLYR